jgi:hypothetical protein
VHLTRPTEDTHLDASGAGQLEHWFRQVSASDSRPTARGQSINSLGDGLTICGGQPVQGGPVLKRGSGGAAVSEVVNVIEVHGQHSKRREVRPVQCLADGAKDIVTGDEVDGAAGDGHALGARPGVVALR